MKGVDSVTIYIVLIALLAILLAFSLFILFRLRRRFKSRMLRLLEDYNRRISDLEKEINRLNYVIADYKRRLKLGGKEVELNMQNVDVNELMLEKQQLERERQHLQEKTKRLWEQSLAIHKEKERIDQLRREIEARHREMVDSVNYALRIQTALLPKHEYLSSVLREYFVLWMPKQIVSGDFYWVKKQGGRLFIVASDCTGHGVPGAFMSLLGISFLEQIVSANPMIEAHQVLEQLRQMVINALQQTKESETKDGMDMALVIVDTQTREAQFAGANNPAYMVRQGQLIELKPVKNPIGIYFRQKPFEKIDFTISQEDIIYMFSDGYADQFNGKTGRKLTKKRFKEILLKLNHDQIPLKDQGKVLKEIILDWRGDARQVDDIMVIGVRI